MTKLIISLVTGMVTLYGMKVAGDGKWYGWLVSLINQVLWFIFILAFQAWGLLPLNVALTVVYARNMAKWKKYNEP